MCRILSENDQLIRNKYKIANIFNNFFINVVSNLGIKVNQQYICNTSNIPNPVEKTNRKYQKRPSSSIIKKWYQVFTRKLLPSRSYLTLQIIILLEIKRLHIKKGNPRKWYTYKNNKAVSKTFWTKILVAVLLTVFFLIILKRQWYIQPIKKIVKLKNLSIYQLASYRISQSLWNCLILPNVYVLQ